MQFIVNADGTERRVIGKRESARLKDAARLMTTISRHVEHPLRDRLLDGADGIEAFLESGSVEDDVADDAIVTDGAQASADSVSAQ